jgi:uncharacterized protein YggU (UPF0235/DUF167 family)
LAATDQIHDPSASRTTADGLRIFVRVTPKGGRARLKTFDIAGEGALLAARLAEAVKGKNA